MSNQTHSTQGLSRSMAVYYTAKNINATAASRSAIASDLAVGAILIADPYKNDGAEGSGGATPINVTQPQTSFLHMEKYVVVDVPSSVNQIPSSAAPTQRRGGYIVVEKLRDSDDITALVDGTTDVAVGDQLEVTNGSFNLTKYAGLTTQFTTITHTAPGTPDYAVQNLVANTGFGFVTADEGNSVLKVVANLQTRLAELETRLTNGVCAVALEARTTNSAGLQRVCGNRV